MTAKQSCQLIGIHEDEIAQPWFVKLIGSIVIYHEPMQLAIRLHWSNTNKQFDSIYCSDEQQAMQLAMENWQFVGRVDTLYKQDKQPLAVYDEQAKNLDSAQYLVPESDTYIQMPANFALSLFEQLHQFLALKSTSNPDKPNQQASSETSPTADVAKLPKLQWLEDVIMQRIL